MLAFNTPLLVFLGGEVGARPMKVDPDGMHGGREESSLIPAYSGAMDSSTAIFPAAVWMVEVAPSSTAVL